MAEKAAGTRGRRTDRARMEHRLKVLEDLGDSCPPLANLVGDLARSAVSRAELAPRIEELARAFGSPRAPTLTGVETAGDDIDECVESAQRIIGAKTRLVILREAQAIIAAAIAVTDHEEHSQWERLGTALAESVRPIPQEIMELAELMVEAGVTGAMVKSKIAKERVLTAAIRGAAAGKAGQSPEEQRQHLSHASLREIWSILPRKIPGFVIDERPPQDSSQSRETIKFYLPPFSSLDEIEPGLSFVIRTLPDNIARYELANEKISRWITTHRYRPGMSTEMAQVRAWCFVLGYVHGFLDGVPAFNRLTIASPWSDKALMVTRTAG